MMVTHPWRCDIDEKWPRAAYRARERNRADFEARFSNLPTANQKRTAGVSIGRPLPREATQGAEQVVFLRPRLERFGTKRYKALAETPMEAADATLAQSIFGKAIRLNLAEPLPAQLLALLPHVLKRACHSLRSARCLGQPAGL